MVSLRKEGASDLPAPPAPLPPEEGINRLCGVSASQVGEPRLLDSALKGALVNDGPHAYSAPLPMCLFIDSGPRGEKSLEASA